MVTAYEAKDYILLKHNTNEFSSKTQSTTVERWSKVTIENILDEITMALEKKHTGPIFIKTYNMKTINKKKNYTYVWGSENNVHRGLNNL